MSSLYETENEVSYLLAGKKFGVVANCTVITNEEGAEIDSIEVIRDNDKLFIVENEEFLRVMPTNCN